MRRVLYGMVALGAVTVLAVPIQGANGNFIPDWTFSGSALTGMQTVGPARWTAANGEIVGTPTAPEGGWLMLDKAFQDVQFAATFQCTGGCKTGVLVRAEKTPTGTKGVYVALTEDGGVASYAVTLDAQGKELTRERLRAGGGQMRVAPSAQTAAAAAAARGGGAGRAGGAGGRAGGAGRGAAPAVALPIVPTDNSLKAGQWNSIEIVIDANILRPWLNTGGGGGGAADEEYGSFGPIALYVGGSGEVRYKDVAYKDLSVKKFPTEKVSANFRMQQLTEYSHSWAVSAADINRDGVLDLVAPPFYFLGPDYTTAREIFVALAVSPSKEYPAVMNAYTGDYTGNGWPDVLTAFPGTGTLYVNPKGEPRRWTKYTVLPAVSSEVSTMKDVDGDGRADLVYASAGALWYASPDPANPTGQWIQHQVSETGTANAHGIGAGDVNGDGRVDVLNVYGWWEQPPAGTQGTWKHHPVAFGRYSGHAGAGGGEMGVYDVNGDKLADVVTSLQAHGWGLSWFEQKRTNGEVSFVEHQVMGDFSFKNAGGVVFSELHGSVAADVTGDGISDFIVGKRHFAHEESYTDPDPYGEAVLYVYRTVRNPKAPGGAELVPELIHNRSGAGSQLVAVDMNKDGALDVLTSTNRGIFIFWGRKR